MKKAMRGIETLSGSLVYFLFGLTLVTLLSVFQGYSANVTTTSFISNSSQWFASILYSWGLLLIFFTSSRPIVRAVWALVVIILALWAGHLMGTQSSDRQYQEPVVSMGHSLPTTSDDMLSFEQPEMNDLNQSYQHAVMAAGWYSILDMSRLKNDTNLIESYAIIEETRIAILSHLLQTQQRVLSLEQRIYNSEANAEAEEDYLDDLIAQTQVQKTMWKAELSALQEVKKIIEMLDEHREGWIIQDGRLLFYAEADKQDFEAIVANLQKITQDQQ